MNILDAFKAAAAAELQDSAKQEAAPKSESKTKAAPKTKAAAPKSEHKDTPKQSGGAKYIIPASFKQAIEDHLKGRADMAEKLKNPGKSIDGCCDYIFDVMRKRAEKERAGKSAVGMYAEPDEIFGLAVHYYDESDESLKSEK
jgi:hypothetical protein